jgi:hypothetical protein
VRSVTRGATLTLLGGRYLEQVFTQRRTKTMPAVTTLDIPRVRHALPADPKQPLWAFHIAGPDDWYAAPSREDAQRLADTWNGWLQNRCTLTEEQKADLHADVRQWAYAQAAHTLSVANWSTTVWDFTAPGVSA